MGVILSETSSFVLRFALVRNSSTEATEVTTKLMEGRKKKSMSAFRVHCEAASAALEH